MSTFGILRINRPAVVSELFDDEVVVIDMVSGNYFSLDATGAEIWTWLAEDAAPEDLVRKAIQTYDGDAGVIETAVREFLERLQAERLVVAAVAPAQGTPQPGNGRPRPAGAAPREHPDPPASKKAFSPPALSVYTDMQDLLLLDPIHDVDETGWPGAREAPCGPPPLPGPSKP